jgi:probable F420-dependent oxidoreductase
MNIGISGANVALFAEREPAMRLVREAEAAGIESIWAFEHVVVPAGYASRYPYSPSGRMPGEGGAPITDPLGWLAFLAAVSERIKIGTGILVLPEHNPVVLAKLTATIDRLSGGRLLLGTGVGWLKEEFDALGVPWQKRGTRMEEYIEVLRRLWLEEEATFNGEFVHLEAARCLPKPFGPSGIPIIVGGHSKAAAERAGRLGDGFFPAALPERVAELVPIMRQSAKRAGRDPDSIEITASAGSQIDMDTLKRYADLGVARVLLSMPTYDPDAVPGVLAALHDDIISRIE